MNQDAPILDAAAQRRRDEFIGRFMENAAGTMNIFAMYIGDRLGLYRGLFEMGPATAAELGAYTRTNPRYLREWLEHQTVNSVLEVLDADLPASDRRYRLPEAHAEPLIQCDSLNYIIPMAQLIAGVVHPLAEIVEAYRSGKGVPYSSYGGDFREGQAAINYPAYANQLSQEWLPAMPDVHARLQADPPARAADFGCGYGWSSLALARGFPKIRVDGYDQDEASIQQARRNAESTRLGERVKFHQRDAGDPALAGRYDLVTAFECIHDMADPVAALRVMRRLVAPNGAVFIADERVGEAFTAGGNDIEGLLYGFSVLHCLPVGMDGSPVNGTGTVMRPETLERYALEAGFERLEILPIENYFFRFYRLYAPE